MERGKGAMISFEETLSYFLKYGALEVSFSSKLVHTLDPEQPIWDRNVTNKHLGYKIPAYGTKEREKKMGRKKLWSVGFLPVICYEKV